MSIAITVPRRAARHPGSRNLAIYEAVRVQRKPQVQVAEEYGVSQPRISQICRLVDLWRGPVGEAGPEQLERRLLRARLEEIYRRAIRALERSQQPLTSERSGERNGQPWSVKSVRERPGDIKWLRIAFWAAERLAEFEWDPRQKVNSQQPDG